MVLKERQFFSLPNAQFIIEGYVPLFRCQFQRWKHSPLCKGRHFDKSFKQSLSKEFERLFVKLNFCEKKILLCCSYNEHEINIANHLDILGKILHIQMSKYNNFLIAGDFSSEKF